MGEFNLKIRKILIVIIVISVVSIIVNGMSLLDNNYYWRNAYFLMQADYLKNEMAYELYENDGFLDWISSFYHKNDNPSDVKETAKSVPILLYHGVIRDSDWQPDEVNVRLPDFRKQMFALKKAGWETISVEDYYNFVQGKKELPAKSFLLTFDDGRSDSFYPVDPILKALDYNAVMYAITNRMFERIGEQGYFHLSRKEFAKMIESGRWQIESHGRDDHDLITTGPDGQTGHFLSSKMWLEKENRLESEEEYLSRIKDDLASSKKDIEKKLGTGTLSFAYPFGDIGETTINFPESRGEVIDSAKESYSISMCQTAGGDYPTNYSEGSFLAKRIVVNSFVSADELIHIFENSNDKAADFFDDFTNNKGWIGGWGTFSIERGSMMVGNSLADDSGIAFLNGSYLWRDYSVIAKVKMVRNGKISLAARYHDAKNYMSCDYSDKNVILTQKMNQELSLEKSADFETGLASGKGAQIGVRVQGNMISCLYNGQEVVSGEIDPNFQKGGIGFKYYNPLERDGFVAISFLKVDDLSGADTGLADK